MDCNSEKGWHVYAGNGANMALRDAWELAKELVDGDHVSFQAAINAYDEKNAQRSTCAILNSHKLIAKVHAGGMMKVFYIVLFKLIGMASSSRSIFNLWGLLKPIGSRWLPNSAPLSRARDPKSA